MTNHQGVTKVGSEHHESPGELNAFKKKYTLGGYIKKEINLPKGEPLPLHPFAKPKRAKFFDHSFTIMLKTEGKQDKLPSQGKPKGRNCNQQRGTYLFS